MTRHSRLPKSAFVAHRAQRKLRLRLVYRGVIEKYSSDNLKVMLVSGQTVRDKFSVDFALAGHDNVYKYIPKGEVWIEEGLSPHDRKVILIHELWERHLMKQGMSYEQAHRRANRVEESVRKSPSLVDETLAEVLKLNQ